MVKEPVDMLSKSRIEALTDSLFATVMTILVLSLVVPIIITGSNTNILLISSIISMLPGILVYVTSFIILGVIWIEHNNIFRYVHEVDNRTQWITIFFLLSVGIIPFSTAFLGRYPLQQPAIILYSINFIIIALMFNLIAYHVMHYQKKRNIRRISRAARSTSISLIIYAIAIPVSYLNSYISLGLFVIVPAYYIISGLRNPS
ncbi:MAG: TMEM175 family protein [Candidatus Micrarchaeaceae archaeon]|jgi:uncharacterized membrane protein